MTSTDRQKAGFHGCRQLKTEPMFHRVFRAESDAVRAALTDIRARFGGAVDAGTLGRLELVLAEVMNNVAEHAGFGDQTAPARLPWIHVTVVRHDSGIACAITDDGISLPEECLAPRSMPAPDSDDLPEGGFGWCLIQGLTQSLCYYREKHRNFLAFSVPMEQA
ncbi:ATP-binding protein [Paracoccus caeni]|uniref:ATP-binding protein n=1 Tax=Paracoccus caeni TaxID=657651 RepID=A0A934SFH6_9RHOB|nr:ATP-binding protein [Paracoccus caeni]MBK4214462.1 ATP-binding protein [Paracoccus caeni]